jgi:hypothetical protein
MDHRKYAGRWLAMTGDESPCFSVCRRALNVYIESVADRKTCGAAHAVSSAGERSLEDITQRSLPSGTLRPPGSCCAFPRL